MSDIFDKVIQFYQITERSDNRADLEGVRAHVTARDDLESMIPWIIDAHLSHLIPNLGSEGENEYGRSEKKKVHWLKRRRERKLWHARIVFQVN